MRKYFPQGVAMEAYFCNREKEKAALKSNIEAHEHIVLMAPRRYGKTSLVTQVLNENDFPGVHIDFFFVLTQADVTQAISEGVSTIISQLLPKSKTAYHKIIDSIIASNPKLTFNILGQKLEIGSKQTTEKNISELLLALDQFAKGAKKTCVLIFDEFQQIAELKENHAIEAAIRHAVERSQYVSYIFCGSKRHLLNEMFSDKSRPLYHLCDLMSIDRIDSEAYYPFLENMAKKKWKKSLDQDVIMEILHLTENHPYYVNALCRRLWSMESPPVLGEVRRAWIDYINQQSVWMINDLSNLSINRRKVIMALAAQATNEPQGKIFSTQVNLNPSTIKRCIDDLHRLDMIYLDKTNHYQVLDPALAYFIRNKAHLKPMQLIIV